MFVELLVVTVLSVSHLVAFIQVIVYRLVGKYWFLPQRFKMHFDLSNHQLDSLRAISSHKYYWGVTPHSWVYKCDFGKNLLELRYTAFR